VVSVVVSGESDLAPMELAAKAEAAPAKAKGRSKKG
jgi:hypothetical protein